MFCKCGEKIPVQRFELGYKDCVACSSVEKKRALDIIFHKTGNTLAHMHAEDYADIEKRFLRKGFRSSLGTIKSGGAKEFSNPIQIGCSTATVGSQGMFDKVGKEMMFKLDLHGVDKALEYLDKCFKSLTINATQYKKLKDIVGNLA